MHSEDELTAGHRFDTSVRRTAAALHWSIVAQGRAARPHSAAVAKGARSDAEQCPFCSGNERETLPEVYSLRSGGTLPDRPGWQIRVVPNRFPALDWRDRVVDALAGPFEQVPADGFHEVVIDTPDHSLRMASYPQAHLANVLGVCQQRIKQLAVRPGVAAVLMFRNDGRAAGASLDHPHSQILAVPMVPGRLHHEIEQAAAYFEATGCCPTCEMLQWDDARGERLVARTDHFAAITSFASRYPYETWVVPRRCAGDFRDCSREEIEDLALMFRKVLAALESVLGSFPFNLILRSSPIGSDAGGGAGFHWRFEILPRAVSPSGLELGWDVFVVSTSPEEAAERLRAAVR